MSEEIVINSQQTMLARDLKNVANRADIMSHLERVVRHEFEEACRQQGIVIDQIVEPVWICRMEAHGVRTFDGRP